MPIPQLIEVETDEDAVIIASAFSESVDSKLSVPIPKAEEILDSRLSSTITNIEQPIETARVSDKLSSSSGESSHPSLHQSSHQSPHQSSRESPHKSSHVSFREPDSSSKDTSPRESSLRESSQEYSTPQQSHSEWWHDARSVVLVSGSDYTLRPSNKIIYVKPETDDITITLNDSCRDAARITIKDVSRTGCYFARITVGPKMRIEHYSGNILVNNYEGTYLLNSQGGAVTFRYFERGRIWTIESQLIGNPKM